MKSVVAFNSLFLSSLLVLLTLMSSSKGLLLSSGFAQERKKTSTKNKPNQLAHIEGFQVVQIDPYYTAKPTKYHAPIEFFLTPTQEQSQALPNMLLGKTLEIYRFSQIDDSLSGQEGFESQRQQQRKEISQNMRAEKRKAEAIKRAEYRKRAELSQRNVIVNSAEESEDEDELVATEEAEFCGTKGKACCGGEYCEDGLSCQSNRCAIPLPPCGEYQEACCMEAQGLVCASDLVCQQQKCILPALPPKQSRKRIAAVKVIAVYDAVIKAILLEEEEENKADGKHQKTVNKRRLKSVQERDAIMLGDIGILAQ